MRTKLILLLVICCIVSCKVFVKAEKNPETAKIDSLFTYHFGILDSIANNKFIDSNLKCIESINFLELNTGISSSSDGNYFGKTSFTKKDLQDWYRWYTKNKKNLNWDKKNNVVKIRK